MRARSAVSVMVLVACSGCWTNATATPASPSTDTPPATEATAAVVQPPSAPASRNYLSGRAIAVGYGAFDYAGHMDGGFTYPPGTTSGITLGGGISYGWYIGDQVALGLMADFDALVSPSAEKDGMSIDGIAALMPNGTLGGFLAYHLSDSMTLESDLAVGGGGTSKAVGGIGLQIHEQLVIGTMKLTDGLWLGPVIRATWGPLMFDPVNGGSLMYYSVDVGVGLQIRR